MSVIVTPAEAGGSNLILLKKNALVMVGRDCFVVRH
jgi:hypothetical protein